MGNYTITFETLVAPYHQGTDTFSTSVQLELESFCLRTTFSTPEIDGTIYDYFVRESTKQVTINHFTPSHVAYTDQSLLITDCGKMEYLLHAYNSDVTTLNPDDFDLTTFGLTFDSSLDLPDPVLSI